MRAVPGWLAFVILLWHLFAIGAPVIVGYRPLPLPVYDCPSPAFRHGIGSNLKTYVVRVDRCADRKF